MLTPRTIGKPIDFCGFERLIFFPRKWSATCGFILSHERMPLLLGRQSVLAEEFGVGREFGSSTSHAFDELELVHSYKVATDREAASYNGDRFRTQ